MHVQSMTTLTHSVQSGAPRRPLARLAVVAIALVTCAVAGAQGLPVQQLTVAFTNAFPNGSVDSLTMPPPPPAPPAAIAAANPLYTGGTPNDLYTALTWVTNPVTSTLDLIYADAEQHKIWRLPGPLYKNPVAIFSWSFKGSGPAYPVGLAADPSGNVYVISPSSAWDKPGVWILPITAKGTYGPPLLIDNTFDDPAPPHKPVSTFALTEVAVGTGAASTPVGGGSPAWNALDLLVLVADFSNTRVIRYSQAQIQSVLSTKAAQQGPASNIITPAQFLTQAIKKFAPIPVGMDIGQDPTTQDTIVLLATVDGRILDFDTAKTAFITPYAINLGLGLTRVKVGTFQGAQYVFVAQLPGRIMEFAAPPSGQSNTTPFASVSKGVSYPSDLAVTQSGTTSVGQQGQGPCISAPCSILPQLSLQFTGPGTTNFPPNDSIAVDSCNINADPRVTIVEGSPTYPNPPVPLNLGLFCFNLPNVWLSANLFGGSGPTGTAFYVAKITATALNQFQKNTTAINNTLTYFTLNPGTVLGNNPPCGSANGPVAGAGPLPGSESATPELSEVPGAASVVYDITVDCSSDPPPGGNNNHPSILVEGTVQGGLTLPYIDGEFSNLQQAFSNMVTPPVPLMPPGPQINAAIQSSIQGYITNSLNYFNAQNYNCALNTLATGARFINSTVNSTPGDFIAGPPPSDNENPSGDLMARLDHLYYDVYVFAYPPPNNPALTTDALNPATAVPACGVLNAPSGLAFGTNGYLYVANYGSGQVLVYAPGTNGQMVQQPSMTLTSGLANPVRLAFAPINESSNISGYLFVADTGNNTVAVFDGNGNSTASIGPLKRPLGVAADVQGFVYVAENFGGPPAVEDIRVYFAGEGWDNSATFTQDSNGVQFATIGALGYNGRDLLVGLPNQINYYLTPSLSGGSTANCSSSQQPAPDPKQATDTGLDGVIGIALDPKGFVYVTNYYGDPTFVQFAPVNGQATALNLTGDPVALSNPQGIAIDASGNIYVSNTSNNTIDVFNNGGIYWYSIH
jgi:hypothetical protein